MIHIVICDNKTKELEKIINKERTVLIRGNAKRRIPHSRIFVNDELYFLEKGSNKSFYHAIVTDANSYSKLTMSEVEDIFDKYKDRLNLCEVEENKWKNKSVCVIEFDNLENIEGIDIPKYTPLEDWIMVSSLDDLK